MTLPSILHWKVRPVCGFTADTDACKQLIERRRAHEAAKLRRAAEEAAIWGVDYDKACTRLSAQADGD